MTVLELILKEIHIIEITEHEYCKLLETNKKIERTAFIEDAIFSIISNKSDMDDVGECEAMSYLLNTDINTFFTKIYKYKDFYVVIL